MINIKPEIVKALKTIPNVNISDEYPSDWSKFPIVTYTEENNSPYLLSDNVEDMTNVEYRIDIWNDRSTSEVATKVDEVMTSLGLRRSFSKDVPIPGLRHKVLRYKGIIDIKTMMVYHR